MCAMVQKLPERRVCKVLFIMPPTPRSLEKISVSSLSATCIEIDLRSRSLSPVTLFFKLRIRSFIPCFDHVAVLFVANLESARKLVDLSVANLPRGGELHDAAVPHLELVLLLRVELLLFFFRDLAVVVRVRGALCDRSLALNAVISFVPAEDVKR